MKTEEADRQLSLRVFLGGQTASVLGDTMLWLAAGVWVKSMTGSNAAAGLVFFFYAAPALLAPLYGWLADCHPRRTVLLCGNAAGMAVVLPLLWVDGVDGVWLVYAVMVAYGALSGVLGAAQSALLVDLAGSAGTSSANSYLRTVREGAKLLGPLGGAGLFALFGPAVVVVFDSVTFAVAAISMLLVRETTYVRAPQGERRLAGLAVGLDHLRSVPQLRRTVTNLVGAMAAVGLIEAALFAVTEALRQPPPFQGVIMTVQGLGAVAAGPFTPRLIRRFGELRLLAASLALLAAAVSLLAAPALPVALSGAAVLGVGAVWLLIAGTTFMQRLTPLALQGRVYAAFDMALTIPQTISIATGALLIAALDYRAVLALTALSLLACAIRAWRLCLEPVNTLDESDATQSSAEANPG